MKKVIDPVSRATANAPIDDEPLSAAGKKALEEAREWSRHNKGIPQKRVLTELGITQKEIDRFREPM